MSQDFLNDMISAPVEPPKKLGICNCGHEGLKGNEYCFICISNINHASMQQTMTSKFAEIANARKRGGLM